LRKVREYKLNWKFHLDIKQVIRKKYNVVLLVSRSRLSCYMTSTHRTIFDAGAKRRSVINVSPRPLYLRNDST